MVKKHFMKRLAWHREKIYDPYDPKYYNVIECIVPEPTRENPYPCILVIFNNAAGHVVMRASTIAEMQLLTGSVPLDIVTRLTTALNKAQIIADEYEDDMRLITERRRLAKLGRKLQHIGIIEEAENIANG